MKATGNRSRYPWLHPLLLLCWLAVGIGLRFTHLASKPPWSDEWATIVFSLGHSFSMVPLDRPISLDTLLLPLQLEPTKGAGDVFVNLMNDSTHPPLYFLLSHWWLKLFSPSQGLVSVWLARSLSAMLGAAAIPAMFGLGWLVCRSLVVGQIGAALMAVSPYGIYLSQEARHYTLAILWVMASLGCFAIALQHLHKAPLPVPVLLIWVGVNSLGMATHYFFILALAAQFLVLLGLWLLNLGNSQRPLFRAANWRRIYAAIAGTLVGVFVWLPALQRIPGNNLTDWIYEGSNVFDASGRILAWIVTMVFLLPVEGTSGIVTILSGVAVLLVLVWLAPAVIRSWQAWQLASTRFVLQAVGGYLVVAIGLIFGIADWLDADLTVAARFQFTYFPTVLLLLGAILGNIWQEPPLERTSRRPSIYSFFSLVASRLGARGKLAVVVTLIMGLLGGLTVVSDFGYQKFERPDLVISSLVEAQAASSEPILMATNYKSHGQAAEMIGLAWQIEQQANPVVDSHFLLVRSDDFQQAARVLEQAIAQFPRLQLWLVNFSAATDIDLKSLGCTADSDQRKAPGYRYQSYRCSN